MAIPVAKRIGLLTIEIDGQFDLEGRGGMTQIDQREILKLEMIGNFEAEGARVEIERFPLVEHADHRVNRFGHSVQLPRDVGGPRLAHCCLKSVAPSDGLATGNGICAPAIGTTIDAPYNPSSIAFLARNFIICITVGVRRL